MTDEAAPVKLPAYSDESSSDEETQPHPKLDLLTIHQHEGGYQLPLNSKNILILITW